MCKESVRSRETITCGQVILILLTGEFLHCIHPSPSLGVLTFGGEGGGLLTEESEVKARLAGYFERLYQADPPAVELDVRGVTIPIADPSINCDPRSFVETDCVEPVEMG